MLLSQLVKIEKDYEGDYQLFHQGRKAADGHKPSHNRGIRKRERNFSFCGQSKQHGVFLSGRVEIVVCMGPLFLVQFFRGRLTVMSVGELLICDGSKCLLLPLPRYNPPAIAKGLAFCFYSV